MCFFDFVANGHGAVAEEGSNGESSPVTDKPSNERDTIRITGQLQNCEAAKEAMMVRNHQRQCRTFFVTMAVGQVTSAGAFYGKRGKK